MGLISMTGDLPGTIEWFKACGPLVTWPIKSLIAFPLVYHWFSGLLCQTALATLTGLFLERHNCTLAVPTLPSCAYQWHLQRCTCPSGVHPL